jgi:hypothetical protein
MTEGANDRSPPDTQTYTALLASIKERIQSAQVRVALAVNRELVLLYWRIGSEITRRQKEEGWGSKVPGRRNKLCSRLLHYCRGFTIAFSSTR